MGIETRFHSCRSDTKLRIASKTSSWPSSGTRSGVNSPRTGRRVTAVLRPRIECKEKAIASGQTCRQPRCQDTKHVEVKNVMRHRTGDWHGNKLVEQRPICFCRSAAGSAGSGPLTATKLVIDRRSALEPIRQSASPPVRQSTKNQRRQAAPPIHCDVPHAVERPWSYGDHPSVWDDGRGRWGSAVQEAIGSTLSTLQAGDLWACGRIIQCQRPLQSASVRFVLSSSCPAPVRTETCSNGGWALVLGGSVPCLSTTTWPVAHHDLSGFCSVYHLKVCMWTKKVVAA